MDPMKALEDLDKMVADAPVSRKTHQHLLMCVHTIREALLSKTGEAPAQSVVEVTLPTE